MLVFLQGNSTEKKEISSNKNGNLNFGCGNAASEHWIFATILLRYSLPRSLFAGSHYPVEIWTI
jgi:hypothetical protein